MDIIPRRLSFPHMNIWRNISIGSSLARKDHQRQEKNIVSMHSEVVFLWGAVAVSWN